MGKHSETHTHTQAAVWAEVAGSAHHRQAPATVEVRRTTEVIYRESRIEGERPRREGAGGRGEREGEGWRRGMQCKRETGERGKRKRG